MLAETEKQELRLHIKDYVSKTLPKAHAPKGRHVCPFCGSGGNDRPSSDSGFKVYEDGFKCFSCHESGDIFSLVSKVENLNDFNEVAQFVRNLYGNTPLNETNKKRERTDRGHSVRPQVKPAPPANIPPFHDSIRGISAETLQRFNVSSVGSCYRVYYGKDTGYYIDYNPNGKPKYKKPSSETHGSEPLFNMDALESGTVWIVEGVFDALSVEEVGGRAVALCGVGGSKLLDALKAVDYEGVLILALDNDPAGRKATKTIKGELKGYNVTVAPKMGYKDAKGEEVKIKDANEYLQANRDKFKEYIEQVTKCAKEGITREEIAALYLANASNYLLAQYDKDRKAFKEFSALSTGLVMLDECLNGGLHQGLYILGAVSSLGKTTLIHQIADYTASTGKPVLFFSLEQSRLELVSKSLARITAQRTGTKRYPLTSLAIREYPHDKQGEQVGLSMLEFMHYADNLAIITPNGTTTCEDIERYVKAYKVIYGKTPLVIVDYLQLIEARGATDKQRADEAIKGLKRIQEEYSLAMVAISSVNRANYLTPFSFEALKESGAIEYTADVVLGLQLSVVNEKKFENEKGIVSKRKTIEEAFKANPRRITLVCLKNRYGVKSWEVPLLYYPSCDLFEQDTQEILADSSEIPTI